MERLDLIRFPLKISLYSVDLGEKGGTYYLYNTLHDILIKLNHEQYAYYQKIKRFERIHRSTFIEDEDFMWLLYKYGFIITSEVNEFDIFLDKINKVKYKDDQLITAVVILGCNMDCTYCFEKWHGSKDLNKKLFLTKEFAKKYMSFVNKNILRNKIKNLKVAWFGGEPLLDYSMVIQMSENLISLSRKYNISLQNYIVTNGTLLHLIPVDKFKLFNFIQVTLDGTREIHDKYRIFPSGKGSFEIIYRNLRYIPRDFELVLRVNVAEEDIEAYIRLLDLFTFRSKYTTVDFSPIFVADVPEEQSGSPVKNMSLDKYFFIEQELINYAVSRGYKISDTLFPHWTNSLCWRVLPYAYHITTEGELYSCVTQLGNRNDYYGFISDDGELVISDWNVYMQNKIYSYTHVSEECKQCPFAPICALSCVHKNGCTIFKDKRILLDRLLLMEKAGIDGGK